MELFNKLIGKLPAALEAYGLPPELQNLVLMSALERLKAVV